MLDHVPRHVVDDDDANTVHFEVVNDTDDRVSGVQLRVRIHKGGILVRHYPPNVRELPQLPKWPDPLGSSDAAECSMASRPAGRSPA